MVKVLVVLNCQTKTLLHLILCFACVQGQLAGCLVDDFNQILISTCEMTPQVSCLFVIIITAIN